MKALFIILGCFVGFLTISIGCKPQKKEEVMELKITSTAFSAGEDIPSKYTCDGDNISPPLSWENIPEAAKSLALIVEDPDAPGGVFTHWVLYDLPANIQNLPEAVPTDERLSDFGGAKQGITDFGKTGYGGPCPPSGKHRYYFRLYAIDKTLGLPAGAKKQEVLDAMKGHILAQGELMGTYAR